MQHLIPCYPKKKVDGKMKIFYDEGILHGSNVTPEGAKRKKHENCLFSEPALCVNTLQPLRERETDAYLHKSSMQ